MSDASAIQVAFPKVDEGSNTLVLATPSAPVGPVSTGLEVYAAKPIAEARQTLSCKDLLQGNTRQQAEAEAAKLYAEMLANTQVFMAYGTQALQGVNGLIDRLMHDVGPVKIPELQAIMSQLNDQMRGIKRKYDVSDPKVREKYEHWKGGILRFVGHARTLLDMLMEDITSMEHQLDKVEKELTGRQMLLLRDVGFYDELYVENEAEILKLIYAIGVMELIRDLAAQNADKVVVGDGNLGDRGGEQKAKLAEFAANMDIKITEYKGRLFVAWATSPQVRTMRTLDVGLAERVNELVCVTLPTMKATIVQWRLLMQAKDAADFAQEVQAASNQTLQAYASASALTVPMIAQAVQTPTLTPQTVAAMADSISQQAEGVIKAMEDGHRQRVELDQAILVAKSVMDKASQSVSDKLIEQVLGAANKSLEVSTSVPAVQQN